MSPVEEQRQQGCRNDREKHDDVEDEETTAEAKQVGKTAKAILRVVDGTRRLLLLRIHSNDLARDEVVEIREEHGAQGGTDQAANA